MLEEKTPAAGQCVGAPAAARVGSRDRAAGRIRRRRWRVDGRDRPLAV